MLRGLLIFSIVSAIYALGFIAFIRVRDKWLANEYFTHRWDALAVRDSEELFAFALMVGAILWPILPLSLTLYGYAGIRAERAREAQAESLRAKQEREADETLEREHVFHQPPGREDR